MKKQYIIGMLCGLALLGCGQKKQPQPPTMYDKLGIDTTSAIFRQHKHSIEEQISWLKNNEVKKKHHMKNYMGVDLQDKYNVMLEEDTLHMRIIDTYMTEHDCSPENDTTIISIVRTRFAIEHLTQKYRRLYANDIYSHKTWDEWQECCKAELDSLNNELKRLANE